MKFFEAFKVALTQPELIKYFQDKGMLKTSIACEKCNKLMHMQFTVYSEDGFRYRCSKCKRTMSIRSGSFLAKSKLSLPTFYAFLYLHHLDVLQKDIAEVLGLAENTVIDYSNFIREQCSNVLITENEMLGGVGIRVQAND